MEKNDEDPCNVFMQDVARTLLGNSKRMVGYLQCDELSPVETNLGKDILDAVSICTLSTDQLAHLEEALNQLQEHMLAWIFSIMDGNVSKSGWPEKIQLVDASGFPICREELQWKFTEALLKVKEEFKQQADDL